MTILFLYVCSEISRMLLPFFCPCKYCAFLRKGVPIKAKQREGQAALRLLYIGGQVCSLMREKVLAPLSTLIMEVVLQRIKSILLATAGAAHSTPWALPIWGHIGPRFLKESLLILAKAFLPLRNDREMNLLRAGVSRGKRGSGGLELATPWSCSSTGVCS